MTGGAEDMSKVIGLRNIPLATALMVVGAGQLVAQEVPSGVDWPVVAEARALHGSGEREASDRAVALLEEFLRTSPGDTAALFMLGDVHIERGWRYTQWSAFESAAEVADRLIPLNAARGYELLARSYRWRGEHSFALDAFERGLEFAPEDAELRAHLAWRHFQTGEHHRGITEAQSALRVDPNSVLALEIYGFSLFHIDVLDPAPAAFGRALAVDSTSEGYGGLHLVSLSRGDYEAAVALAERILAEHPEWPQAYAFYGHAHYFAGNEDEAIRYLEEARRRNPNVGVQYTGRSASTPLAYLYSKQGRHDEAAAQLAHAEFRADRRMYFGFEPWNSYYQFAGIALLRGDRDGALRWLQTALIGGMPGPVLIEHDPIYAELRGDQQFEEIVRRLRSRRDEIQERLGLR
jgi:tetratricopeptide (TPR) repeat protein